VALHDSAIQGWRITSTDVLLVVDVQNDFLPRGRLAVPQGDRVIAPLNRYIRLFSEAHRPMIATRDWHPENHCSFSGQGGPWPVHCVAETGGAAVPASLNLPEDVPVISKATKPDADAYSGFEGTDLGARLSQMGARRLFLGGLATDYCVLNTARDALESGFAVCLLTDAIRAVNVKPGDGDGAVAEMTRLGALPVELRGYRP